jgi:hypothetical protein
MNVVIMGYRVYLLYSIPNRIQLVENWLFPSSCKMVGRHLLSLLRKKSVLGH